MRCRITLVARQLSRHSGGTALPEENGNKKTARRYWMEWASNGGDWKALWGECFSYKSKVAFRYLVKGPIPRIRKIQKGERFTDQKFHPRVAYISVPAFITVSVLAACIWQ